MASDLPANHRLTELVQRLNYHNNTFARIPLTTLEDVGRTAAMIIRSVLDYKTTAILFEKEKGISLIGLKSESICDNMELKLKTNPFIEGLWHDLYGPQSIQIRHLDPEIQEELSILGIRHTLFAVPIIGTVKPGEKQVGMVLASDPPGDLEPDSDILVLEIITGLISGAIANCLSLQSINKINKILIERKDELKHALESLEASHDRLLTILDSIEAVVYIIDIKTYCILYINRFGKAVYGDVIGDTCWQAFHKDMTGPCSFCPIDSLVTKKGKSSNRLVREQFNPFDKKWYSMHDRLLQWVDGSLVKIQISVDITDRIQKENEIKSLRKYLSNIIDSMPSLLIGVDKEKKVNLWNKKAEKTTGINMLSAREKPVFEVYPSIMPHMDDITRSIQKKEIQHKPKQIRTENHQTYYEDITIYPLMSDWGNGAVIRIDDVNEKVRMEEIMIQSEKMLSVGGLAAGMAHEINNPLAGMLQNAAVLENRLGRKIDNPANQKAALESGTTMTAIKDFMENRGIRRIITNINDAGKRATEIVKNMLSFSRKHDAHVASYIITDLVDKTLELAAIDFNMKKHDNFLDINIIKNYDACLPHVPCEGATIQQVILNILRNGAQAMKHAGTEKPIFTIRIQHEKETRHIRIEIEDNGPGMDEKTQKRVFEPFFTTKPVGMGTGLGLSVSYFIITHNHGGEIRVQSKLGFGARFIIRLPLSRKQR